MSKRLRVCVTLTGPGFSDCFRYDMSEDKFEELEISHGRDFVPKLLAAKRGARTGGGASKDPPKADVFPVTLMVVADDDQKDAVPFATYAHTYGGMTAPYAQAFRSMVLEFLAPFAPLKVS